MGLHDAVLEYVKLGGYNVKVGFENDSLIIKTLKVEDREGCIACKSFTAIGKDGVAGYIKFAHGDAPTNNESGFAQLYVKSDDRLYFKTSDGSEHKVELDIED